ncbi:MAG: carboxy methyl transferase for protein phosphatase 2A [Tremellales sp. Tagirdzhanova-0007]|nr:MAG: carboxy methyl transferase for protein phosphatase 2A [Tremellales sp. Tagirdzhanova-0007]
MKARGRPVDGDEAIRQTDDDAAASRLSAANLGYLNDPFASLLYKSPLASSSSGPSRKPPLINVGTHHRTYAIDFLVDRFFATGGKQVVSLGAGSDTRFWRLMSRSRPPGLVRYVELDFPNVTSLKAQRISRSPQLSSSLNNPSASTPSSSPPSTPQAFNVSQGGTCLSSTIYKLLPLDLRESPSSSLNRHLLPHLDPKLPTIFLAECVFCYMRPDESREVIRWFGERFERCCGAVYEMCGLEDTFGNVMKRNLASRGLSLPGAEPFRDTQSQAARFLDTTLGEGVFQMSGAKSLWEIRNRVIAKHELARIAKLEHLDEIEELRLVLSHYCVAWGTKGEDMHDVGL